MFKPLIAYYRVSTREQGRSGLGIDAQRAAVARFAEAEGFEIVAEFTEIETGKGSDALERRPQLAASTGAQGTLGGLVGTAPRFAEILESALRRVEICSNDPVCADHEPDGRSGDRATHGAACHGCMLIAETSCESRNQFLDRALLVRTMQARDAAFVAFEQM